MFIPDKTAIAPVAFGKTKDMMRVYEQLTGVDFPYNKYDQTIVADFNFGGMENITATTMADTEILLANLEFGKDVVEDLVSHEFAHSWFGDLVTCKNWSEFGSTKVLRRLWKPLTEKKCTGATIICEKSKKTHGNLSPKKQSVKTITRFSTRKQN